MGGMLPIGPEVFEIICGLGEPSAPGMHGVMKTPAPPQPAIELATKIRDMCDEFICTYGKECEDGELQSDVQERGQKGPKEKQQDSEDEQGKLF